MNMISPSAQKEKTGRRFSVRNPAHKHEHPFIKVEFSVTFLTFVRKLGNLFHLSAGIPTLGPFYTQFFTVTKTDCPAPTPFPPEKEARWRFGFGQFFRSSNARR
jgi:hypothetical protein